MHKVRRGVAVGVVSKFQRSFCSVGVCYDYVTVSCLHMKVVYHTYLFVCVLCGCVCMCVCCSLSDLQDEWGETPAD